MSNINNPSSPSYNLEGSTERILRSKTAYSGSPNTLTSTNAYFLFLGVTVNKITPKFVQGICGGTTGTESLIEVGLFSSPTVPSRSSQTLTTLVSGTVSSFTANTFFQNASTFSTSISSGTNLWTGVRVVFSVSPQMGFANNDFNFGNELLAASTTAFSSTGSYATTIPSAGTLPIGSVPWLTATLD